MKKEQLEKAINLQCKIKTTETLLENLKDSSYINSIDFVFMYSKHSGDLANKSVCYNQSVIEKVKQLLILETELILDNLNNEFKNL
jgi:hypothetical protein